MTLETNAVTSMTLADVQRRLVDCRASAWLGSVSFEERCIGSLIEFHRAGITVENTFVFEYKRAAVRTPEEIAARQANKESLELLAAGVSRRPVTHVPIEAYSFQEFADCLTEIVADSDLEAVVIDVSCLTKIHTLALASAIATWPRSVNLMIAYSVPENYGVSTTKRRSLGWKDILVAPLAETAHLLNESQGRGIIVPGHEADRLIIGLAEMEPAGGLVLMADTPRRPDLRFLCERANQRVLKQLTVKHPEKWRREIVPLLNTSAVPRLVDKEIHAAAAANAPILLFPFGPKIILFLVATRLASSYPGGSWFVYPVPFGYSVDYSTGIEQTLWTGLGGLGGE